MQTDRRLPNINHICGDIIGKASVRCTSIAAISSHGNFSKMKRQRRSFCSTLKAAIDSYMPVGWGVRGFDRTSPLAEARSVSSMDIPFHRTTVQLSLLWVQFMSIQYS